MKENVYNASSSLVQLGQWLLNLNIYRTEELPEVFVTNKDFWALSTEILIEFVWGGAQESFLTYKTPPLPGDSDSSVSWNILWIILELHSKGTTRYEKYRHSVLEVVNYLSLQFFEIYIQKLLLAIKIEHNLDGKFISQTNTYKIEWSKNLFTEAHNYNELPIPILGIATNTLYPGEVDVVLYGL